jgi:8-oxo-dGTP pyrophosphatase MutT (NUDIX family)
VAVPRGVGVRATELAAGQHPVPEPRDAATVVLLRPASLGVGVEVLLQGRARAMDFAPGAHVFPGGSVDPRDADFDDVSWAGPSAADLSGLLGVPPERSRALVSAAVRETFEESGVLLAGSSAESVSAGSGAALAQARRVLLAGSVSLGDLLRDHDLVLRADLLTPWARWITPEASNRRFDTWFFVAALPPGQTADAGIGTAGAGTAVETSVGAEAGTGAEADSAVWLRPAGALDAARAGQITLLPPTAVTLAQLTAYDSVAEILAQRRTITPLMPSVQVEDGRTWLAMPDGVDYPL